MLLATRWALIPAIFAGVLCLAAPASAVAPEVKDEAGLFSADAIKRANDLIREIDRRYKKDLVIETYKAIPADKQAQFKSLGRENFFAKWASDRFSALRTDGIYIMICDNPKQLEVVLGAKTQQHDFRPADRDRLRKDFVASLKAGKPDQALINGAQFVSDTLQTNQKTPASTAPARKTASNPAHSAPATESNGSGWGGMICMGLLILGGIWLVIGLVRAFTGGMGGGGGYGPGGGWGGGGGGFFSSLMGGLFGAAAGMYLYNNFFGGHSTGFGSTAYGSDASSSPSGSDEGQVGSTTGDDWGSDSGGDSGGGDWGGGDSGGGGDWGGGGGGDWGGGGGDFGGGGDW